MFRDEPQSLGAFGGSVADFMRSTGETDAKKAVAFMMSVQEQGRFSDLNAMKQVMPALANAGIVGGKDQMESARQAGAFFGAFGKRTGDVDAALTKTATVKMMTGIEKAVPEGRDLFERIDILRRDQERRGKFLKEGGFEGAEPVIRELLSDSSSIMARSMAEAYAGIQGSVPAYERKVKQLENVTPALAHAGAMGELENIGNTSDLTDETSSSKAVVAKALAKPRGLAQWEGMNYGMRTALAPVHAIGLGMQSEGQEATKYGIESVGYLKEMAGASMSGGKRDAVETQLKKILDVLERQLVRDKAGQNQISAASANAQSKIHKE
jgi:hypothetical protein